MQALSELREIRVAFSRLRAKDIVWDVEDLTIQPPKGFLSNKSAFNLSECFIAVGNRNLIICLEEILEFCIRNGISVKIPSERDLIK